MSRMNRTTWIAVAMCSAAVLAVAAGTVHVVRRQQAQAVAEFSADRLRAVGDTAAEMDKDFANIGDVLQFAGQLFATAESNDVRRRELSALVAVLKQYLLVVVYDADGKQVFETQAPDVLGLRASEFYGDMGEVARRALAIPQGQIEASPPFTVDGGAWFRVFATSFAGGGARPAGAVALLVDTQPMFSKLRLIVSEPESRLLVLGAHGLPTPASAPALAAAVDNTAVPEFAALVADMRAGGTGTMRLGPREAEALGLEPGEVVAAYAAIRFRGGHWSIATLSSTATLRAYEWAILVRLGVAGLAVVLCLVLFSAYAIWAHRRASRIRERLRHAAQVERILENVPAGVMALSAERRITSVNRALRERLPPDPCGHALAQAFHQAPAPVIARLEELLGAALGSERVHSLLGEHLALFGKEGQYNVYAVPLEPQFPEARALLVIEDVSEVRSLESSLLRAEKLATIGVLAAGIAHEVGTPLGVVRGRAEYILGKLPADSPHTAGLNVVLAEIDRVTRTIRQLLDFSRIKPAQVRATAVAPGVRAVVELLRFEAERRQLALTVEVPDTLPFIAADPDQLQQVLVNLLMNACDACRAGGRIAVAARLEEVASKVPWTAVRIDIVDDGCGIPEEYRHQVFDPFFTTKKRGQGTGLGLSVAAQIVRNHGGQIELEGAEGRGARASVLWPLAPSRAESHDVAS